MVATRRHVAVIPCRWGASRFPGKPLAGLGDMPLLRHVHRRCQEAHQLANAVVTTDDDRIEATCRRLDILCIMTGGHLNAYTALNSSDRGRWGAPKA